MYLSSGGRAWGPGAWSLILSPDDIDGRVIHPPSPGSIHATWYALNPLDLDIDEECGSAKFQVPEGEEPFEIVLPMPNR